MIRPVLLDKLRGSDGSRGLKYSAAGLIFRLALFFLIVAAYKRPYFLMTQRYLHLRAGIGCFT